MHMAKKSLEQAEQKIDVTSSNLPKLMVAVANGTYRIPQFQRDFVWSASKIIELLDSIFKEYPIGSFFLWNAGREHNHLFRHIVDLDIPPVGKHDNVSFILDGQQRVTSLYVTLNGLEVRGKDYSKICLDLKGKKFVEREADNERYVSVSTIWGSEAMMLLTNLDPELQPAMMQCWQTFRTYPLSLVEVRDKDLPAVCRIFQRINQGGKRLDRFDLIAATTFTPDFNLRERFEKDITHRLVQDRFGKIKPFAVTQLLALMKSGQCTDFHQFSLTADDIQKFWQPATQAVLLAAATLRDNFGVANASYLPYETFITLLAYYFQKSGNRALPPKHFEWVRQWFWRSAFTYRYGSGGNTRIGQDRDLFDKIIAGASPTFEPALQRTEADLVHARMTTTTSALRNAFLCMLCVQRPTNLRNNAELNLVNGSISDFTSPEKHHIFPQGFLNDQDFSGWAVHSLTNFCFLPNELNNYIRARRPSDYMAELKGENTEFAQAAQKSLLPIGPDSALWTDEYVKFQKQRAAVILDEIRRICEYTTAPRKGERQATIAQYETQLRDLIHVTLEHHVGHNYWKQNVPPIVRQQVEERIKAELDKCPDRNPQDFASPRVKLNFCNVPDYATIIENGANWPFFDPVFKKKQDMQTYLRFFSDYRNCVMHNRDMGELLESQGETALVWLANVLPDESGNGESGEDADVE